VSSLQEIRADGKEAVTVFEPIGWANGYTLARIRPETGRMHQIRVHAAWMGAPVAGDKMYAAGEECYLEFVRHGFTPRLRESLQASRHLLHAESIRFPGIGAFLAPMAEDMLGFWANQAFASTDAALRT
jgi:23S rRNA pseudouridine1911/1915/1917 synthase